MTNDAVEQLARQQSDLLAIIVISAAFVVATMCFMVWVIVRDYFPKKTKPTA